MLQLPDMRRAEFWLSADIDYLGCNYSYNYKFDSKLHRLPNDYIAATFFFYCQPDYLIGSFYILDYLLRVLYANSSTIGYQSLWHARNSGMASSVVRGGRVYRRTGRCQPWHVWPPVFATLDLSIVYV